MALRRRTRSRSPGRSGDSGLFGVLWNPERFGGRRYGVGPLWTWALEDLARGAIDSLSEYDTSESQRRDIKSNSRQKNIRRHVQRNSEAVEDFFPFIAIDNVRQTQIVC